ncbi:MAG: hypothetical protein AAGU19_05050 [Prolixibacteraceae bacterium]
MFFLGIAGPLLPYFLMIGVLVAFTLEAGAEMMRKAEKEPADNHHIRLATTETEAAAPEGLFYFRAHPDRLQDQGIEENASLAFPGFLFPYIENEEQVVCRDSGVRLAGYVDCYFGLSPPDRCVS